MCAARWTKYKHGANITLNLVLNFAIQILLQENAFDRLNSSLAGKRSRKNGELFPHSGRAQIVARAKWTKQGVVPGLSIEFVRGRRTQKKLSVRGHLLGRLVKQIYLS